MRREKTAVKDLAERSQWVEAVNNTGNAAGSGSDYWVYDSEEEERGRERQAWGEWVGWGCGNKDEGVERLSPGKGPD